MAGEVDELRVAAHAHEHIVLRASEIFASLARRPVGGPAAS
jgi:hypothetical protein